MASQSLYVKRLNLLCMWVKPNYSQPCHSFFNWLSVHLAQRYNHGAAQCWRVSFHLVTSWDRQCSNGMGKLGWTLLCYLQQLGSRCQKNTKVGKGQSPTSKINLVYPASLKINSSLLYLLSFLSLVVLDKSSKLLQTPRSMPFKPPGLWYALFLTGLWARLKSSCTARASVMKVLGFFHASVTDGRKVANFCVSVPTRHACPGRM